jgi:hypothetical protein
MNVLHEQITGKPLLLIPTTSAPNNTKNNTKNNGEYKQQNYSSSDALPHFLDRPHVHEKRNVGVVVQVVPKRKASGNNEETKEGRDTKKVKTTQKSLVDYGDEDDDQFSLPSSSLPAATSTQHHTKEIQQKQQENSLKEKTQANQNDTNCNIHPNSNNIETGVP